MGERDRQSFNARAPIESVEMRHTGITTVGDVHWGTHFCQFYQDKQELIEPSVPYFKAGLKSNEFCIWSRPTHCARRRPKLPWRLMLKTWNHTLPTDN